jgi:hypothetical protein
MAVAALRHCFWAEVVIIYNAYTAVWLIPALRYLRDGYAYDTVDFSDTEDIIKSVCQPGFSGIFKRLRLRLNYRAFLKFLDGCNVVVTNTQHCMALARERRKSAFLFTCPLAQRTLRPICDSAHKEPFVIGWEGSVGTAGFLEEYTAIFAEFSSRNGVSMELMEADQDTASKTGAVVLPWTFENFCERLPHWSVGLAPLPSRLAFAGKFPSKIVNYMAAGIPSVVTPKGMATWLIKHKETGLYAETPDDWREAIQYFIDRPDEVVRMGANARRDFEQRLSLEAQMPEYERVVLGSNSAL